MSCNITESGGKTENGKNCSHNLSLNDANRDFLWYEKNIISCFDCFLTIFFLQFFPPFTSEASKAIVFLVKFEFVMIPCLAVLLTLT